LQHSRRLVMFGRSKDEAHGPGNQHPYVEPRDPRGGLAVAGVQSGLQQAPAIAVTDATVRLAPCAMKGCGRPRQDAIHEPEE
jgi:hypothetical protein